VIVRRSKQLVRALLRRFGFDIVRYLPKRRLKILEDAGITVVLDVGANIGQYACALRDDGFAGRIVSFEPLADAFARLSERAARDPRWECRQLALGYVDREATINVAADRACSSLLPVRERHSSASPDWAFVGHEPVVLRRLDTVCPELLAQGDRPYLKLDVQGLELEVLRGSQASLERIQALETELSLDWIYDGQSLLPEVAGYLYERGFRLVWIERILNDPLTDHLLQVDAIFMRDPGSVSVPRPSGGTIP
jgi:FkbM family methyltransferase